MLFIKIYKQCKIFPFETVQTTLNKAKLLLKQQTTQKHPLNYGRLVEYRTPVST